MISSHLFRRIFHMTAAIYLIYYLLPNVLLPGFYKWYGVLGIVGGTLVVEIIRLRRSKVLFGLREYEKTRISAFAWFALGMGVALLLFEMEFVVPVVIGMAFIDPLIGEIRRNKIELYPLIPLVCYGFIMLICLLFLSSHNFFFVMILTVLGTVTAIAAESLDVKSIDDDFLMIVIPLLVLSGFKFIFDISGSFYN
jgi:hypothetical protein